MLTFLALIITSSPLPSLRSRRLHRSPRCSTSINSRRQQLRLLRLLLLEKLLCEGAAVEEGGAAAAAAGGVVGVAAVVGEGVADGTRTRGHQLLRHRRRPQCQRRLRHHRGLRCHLA